MKHSTLLARMRTLAAAAILAATAGHGPTAHAAQLTFANVPLFLGGVPPNVFFELDDSGSMDWEFLTGKHYAYISYDPDEFRTGAFNSYDTGPLISDGLWYAWSPGPHPFPYNYFYPYNVVVGQIEFWNNTDNAYYSNVCLFGDFFACPSASQDVDWRGRSAGLNVTFYNSAIDYLPWRGPCKTDGSPCVNAKFGEARSNPREGTDGYNLKRDLRGFFHDIWIDDKGYSGSRPHRGSNFNDTATPNNLVDLWDSHIRVTFDSGKATLTGFKYFPNTSDDTPNKPGSGGVPSGLPDPLPRGLNEIAFPLSGPVELNGSDCFNALGKLTLAEAQAILNDLVNGGTGAAVATGGPNCRTIIQAEQNVANWYQYARRRSFVAKGAIASVMDTVSGYRYGLSVINDYNNLFTEMPSAGANLLQHNADLLRDLFLFDWPPYGTPLRAGLKRAGDYYDDNLSGKSDPIIESCQKNFTVLFTDGYYNGSGTGTGDEDNDGISDRLSDIAKKYYDKDLSGLPNNVPPDSVDPATYQHMVTMSVAFGVEGDLVDRLVNSTITATPPPPPGPGDAPDGKPDVDAAGDLWAAGNEPQDDGDWGDPLGSDPARIDDMWHAAHNSKGVFISANNPAELVQAFEDTLGAIADRVASASAVALNSGSLNENSRTYQARFDSENWSGQLLAFPISDGNDTFPTQPCYDLDPGEICPQEWNAADKLDAQHWDTGREIIVYKPSTGDGAPFRWASLDAGQQAELDTNPDTGAADGNGSLRLDYLRGDATNELSGLFRNRGGKLGDIVHSSPVLAASPPFGYPDSLASGADETYTDFIARVGNRTPVIYVGANDGMLHGFDASFDPATNLPYPSSGQELLAFVPNTVLENMNELTTSKYNHRYFVNGNPTRADVIFDSDNKWHTVIVGTLNAGGQGVFALDVTDPNTFDEGNAADIVLWEFTDTDNPATTGVTDGDADLGYTFSQASVFRMRNGKWAAMFGNGYNSNEADGSAGAGDAVLYIVDIETGDLIRKLATGATSDPSGKNRPNGLATPVAIDMDGDYYVDAIYAGDLFGNLWKFDVDHVNPANWNVAFNGNPLFVAMEDTGDPASVQPITTKPVTGPHPTDTSGIMVYFGSGKYIEPDDNKSSGAQTQTLYGIYDNGNKVSGSRSDLLRQDVIAEVYVASSGETVRVTSDQADDPKYQIYYDSAPNHRGWYMDLIDPASPSDNRGELVSADPILRNGRIIFVTTLPDEDACSSGGDSYLMELDASDGSRLDFTPFDVNADDTFDSDDFVEVVINGQTVKVAASGRMSKQGIIQKPGVLSAGNTEYKYASGSSGGIDVTTENPGPGNTGRQSWKQLR